MITNIRLENFKCFEMLDIPIAPLTLLCGVNGMGKSSVFQALLALRQSVEPARFAVPEELILAGGRVDIGTGTDVLFEDAKEETLRIEVKNDATADPYGLSFDYVAHANQWKTNRKSETCQQGPCKGWNELPPVGGDLVYVNAERVGPRKLYPLLETVDRRGDIGDRGERSLAYLNSRQGFVFPADDPRGVPDQNGKLQAVLEYWLSGVSPGVRLHLEKITEADALQTRFSFDRKGDVETRPYRATNVGFGLSYTLPVLIALLSLPGTLCLIENPEAHLHPQGQAQVAELAALAAIAGVQVILETHSDHIMDGIRVAVHDAVLTPEQVRFHYFDRVGGRSIVSTPKLNSDGRLSDWPPGFFDQHDKNLVKLIKPRPCVNVRSSGDDPCCPTAANALTLP